MVNGLAPVCVPFPRTPFEDFDRCAVCLVGWHVPILVIVAWNRTPLLIRRQWFAHRIAQRNSPLLHLIVEFLDVIDLYAYLEHGARSFLFHEFLARSSNWSEQFNVIVSPRKGQVDVIDFFVRILHMKMLGLPATEHFLVELDDLVIEPLDKNAYVIKLRFQIRSSRFRLIQI